MKAFKMNKKIRIYCILGGLLGNKTQSNRFLEALKKIDWIEFDYFFVTPEDYHNYSAPIWLKWSSALEVAYIAHKKFNDKCKDRDFEILLINGYEIAQGVKDIIRQYPTILALDATPILAHELLQKITKDKALCLRSQIAKFFMGHLFRNVFSNVDWFMPCGRWCGDAIAKSYHISPSNMTIIYCPIHLDTFKPSLNNSGRPFTVLFIGNDFLRKGGDLLLRIYKKFLYKENIRLKIVSSDSCLSRDFSELAEGVEILKDLSEKQIINVFQSADLFVLPTIKEYLGNVIAESLSVGVPVITRDVGSLKEMVKDGFNGILMPYNSSEEEWVQKILYLYRNKNVLREYSINARKTAEEMFDFNRFKVDLEQILKKVNPAQNK